MEVTEKWLGEIGGWAALKAARGLVDAGLVTVQSASSDLIRGLAGSGKMKFAAGLRIRSRSDVDNLCACPAGRRGAICEHSIAVALAWMKGQAAPAAAKTAAPISAPAPKPPGRIAPAAGTAAGRYSIFLPEGLLRGELKEPAGVYVRFEPGGEAETSRLAAWLAAQGVGGQSAPLSLRGETWTQFLAALAGHPRVAAGKPSAATPVSVAADPVPLPVLIEQAGDQEVAVRLQSGTHRALDGAGVWWICRETLTLFRTPPAAGEGASLLAALAKPDALIRRPLRWLVGQRGALGDLFQVELVGQALEHFHVAPVQAEFELQVDGSLQAVDITVSGVWNKYRWNLLSGDDDSHFLIQDELVIGTFYVRDRNVESRFLAALSAMGFGPAGPSLALGSQSLRLTGADAVLAFFSTHLPRLERDHRVVLGDRWRAATRGVSRIVPRIRTEAESVHAAGGDWLAMEFAYEAPDGFRLPRSEVLRLVRSGQRSVKGQQGRRYLLDLAAAQEFEETLRDVPIQLTADGAKINALHAPYFLPDSDAGLPPLPEESEVLPLIGDLGPKLRPYQLLGVRWMRALAAAGRGGVLGDEMGLGKTVQSIALIRSLVRQADTGGALPTLIVCPKSLIGNWLAEFQRFAPDLRVAGIRGGDRAKLLERIDSHDVLITSYQLIIRDLPFHKKHRWRLVLLDEASYIRNPDTEAAKALRQLQAGARLALTGTPVENSTRDLWSIYHFLLPGFLGSRDNFKERFEQPIQSGFDSPEGQAAGERLKKLVRPYFLRRTKREVLRDLPEKIEQVLWCEPSQPQMEVYRRLLEEGREEIKAARRRSGQSGAKMTMFTVLLRLRQACCDLRLTGLQGAALEGLERDELSGKWPMLEEHLTQIIDGGGKVLIFSQFVQYLRLVRGHLEAEKVPFCYLDGSSEDREAQVIRFQTDPQQKVFLISLKAGGYGLNLTAADHVILLDPWWNPAVEAQAIDRAHRIGQQRVVNAYRLAIRGTVEERILALQARKRGLIEATLDEKSPLMAGLQTDDLEQLIEAA